MYEVTMLIHLRGALSKRYQCGIGFSSSKRLSYVRSTAWWFYHEKNKQTNNKKQRNHLAYDNLLILLMAFNNNLFSMSVFQIICLQVIEYKSYCDGIKSLLKGYHTFCKKWCFVYSTFIFPISRVIKLLLFYLWLQRCFICQWTTGHY